MQKYLAIDPNFLINSTENFRRLAFNIKISWTKQYDPTMAFARVDHAHVDVDVVKGSGDETITEADRFEYEDETEYITSFEYERALDEPLMSMVTSVADVVLENTSDRFTFGHDAVIGNYILPQRVLKLRAGVEGIMLPVFEGVTISIEEKQMVREVMISSRDFLDTFKSHEMSTLVFVNKSSDEIIKDVLQEVGYGPTQFDLEAGDNTPGVAIFRSGKSAYNVIKAVCEAEGGRFFQDEEGKFKFWSSSHTDPVAVPYDTHDVHSEDLIDIEYDYSKIINKCVVKSDPREEQPVQVVWEQGAGIVTEIPPASSITVWATHQVGGEDTPCTSIETPLEGTDYISFDAASGGSSMAADVDMTSFSAFTDTSKMVLHNNHATKIAYLQTFQLRGNPAVSIGTIIKEIAEDVASQDLYGVKSFEIDNDLINDTTDAQNMAQDVVTKYANPLKRVNIKIKGLAHAQVGDKLKTSDDDGAGGRTNYKYYRIIGIRSSLTIEEGFLQEIILNEE